MRCPSDSLPYNNYIWSFPLFLKKCTMKLHTVKNYESIYCYVARIDRLVQFRRIEKIVDILFQYWGWLLLFKRNIKFLELLMFSVQRKFGRKWVVIFMMIRFNDNSFLFKMFLNIISFFTFVSLSLCLCWNKAMLKSQNNILR